MENTMPKTQLDSNFWRDDFIHFLTIKEKFLYFYLITCPASNIAGIYEIPLHEIESHTGLTKGEIKKIFESFFQQDKVLYQDGWVCLKNRCKYNVQDNDDISVGVVKIINKAPNFIKAFINNTVGTPSPHSGVNDIIYNKIRLDKIEYNSFIDFWNSKEYLNKIQAIGKKRKASLKERFSETFFKDNWQAAIDKIKDSDFLMGRSPREEKYKNWKPNIDWFLRPDTVIKIMEGKYEGKQEVNPYDN